MKKILSFALAIVVLFTSTSFSLVSSFAIEGSISNDFSNIDTLACEIQSDLLNSNQGEEFAYNYYSEEYISLDKLESDLIQKIYTLNDENPRLGQYFQKAGDINIRVSYHSVLDYYEIHISRDFTITEAEELYVEKFAEMFKEKYIPKNADDYTKVKVIYDFIVRNSDYDKELFNDKRTGNDVYSTTSDRFRIAHSAYGALIGNRISYQKDSPEKLVDEANINNLYEEYKKSDQGEEYIDHQIAMDFDRYFKSKSVFHHESIVDLPKDSKGYSSSNGRAVCEGYSKLFYYLCVDNGIKARIVDGDYVEYISNDPEEIVDTYGDATSGKASDPHEWNYVFLDDGVTNADGTPKGKRWFMVDATWGSQFSLRNIDYNSYDYFLIGSKYASDGITINPYYSVKEHPQPYFKSFENLPQLYDWYAEENIVNDADYNIAPFDLALLEFNDDDHVIIERLTDYGEGEKAAYILQGYNSAVKISINDDEHILDGIDGFEYNGRKTSKYTLIIPYLTGYEYKSPSITGFSDVGTYNINSYGLIVDGEPTHFGVDFKIAPIDMSKSTSYSEMEIASESNYNGNVITPLVKIIDGHSNILTKNDYEIVITQNGKSATLKEMGVYDIEIKFKGNYTGSYSFQFTIGKIDLSQIRIEYPLPYLPEFYRKEAKIEDASDFFNQISKMKIGTQLLVNGTDFTVATNGEFKSFGDSGEITISSTANSTKCVANKKTVGKYTVSELFDIAKTDSSATGVNLNNQVADTNTVNHVFYDGTAKTPTVFDSLDERLVRGKEYKIVGYSDNVNAGEAYVIIEGIEKNGCTGRAKMKFIINRANITTSKVTASLSGSTLSAKVVWNDKTLVEGTDYKKTIEKQSSTSYMITIEGINNFAGTMRVQTQIQPPDPTQDPTANYVKPSTSGNTLKLSKTSYVYSGSACKPTVTLLNKNGKAINTYYYTVKYSNNTNVGTAKVTISFRNGYSGSASTTFTIKPKSTTISSLTAVSKGFTVKWKKQSTQTNGYQIQYSTSSKFSSPKTVTVTKNSTISKKITKLTAKKKYYVRIRTYKTVSGKKYYSSWSASKYVTTKK